MVPIGRSVMERECQNVPILGVGGGSDALC
jgi:hypothetical protein